MLPWTRRLSVSWRPSLGFHIRRYEVLRALEEEGLVQSFRIHESGRVAVRLGDPAHLIVVREEGVDAALLAPDADRSRVTDAIERLWEVAGSPTVIRPRFVIQWLVALSESYDDARKTGFAKLFGAPGTASYEDFAATLVGNQASIGMAFMAEFGIVQRDEAPKRLARTLGAFRAPEADIPPTVFPEPSLPPVAFFFDSTWAPAMSGAATLEGVMGLWDESVDACGSIVSDLLDELELKSSE